MDFHEGLLSAGIVLCLHPVEMHVADRAKQSEVSSTEEEAHVINVSHNL